jgi:hypothetical protein
VRPAPGWRVQVEAHTVARWSIEAQVLEVRAISDVHARVEAAREVHRRAGVTPWKPLLRTTYRHTRVLERLDDGRGGRRRGITAIPSPEGAHAPPANRVPADLLDPLDSQPPEVRT